MRVLLDTDVILDFILERDPYVEAAAELLHFNARERYQGFVSSITPINVFYIGRKSVGAAKARQGIADLLAALEVCPVTHSSLSDALNLPFTDYEDAVQCSSATANGLDAIITAMLRTTRTPYSPFLRPRNFFSI